jgi:predicted nucleotidyltransferase
VKKYIFEKFNISSNELKKVCNKYRVKNLYVFGSIQNGLFKKGESDIDFLVEFENVTFDNYFNLLEDLQSLLNYEKIDLVTIDSIKNKIIKEEIDSTREILYAA